MGCSSSQEARLVPTENGDATKVEQDDAKSEKVVLSDGETMEDFGEDAGKFMKVSPVLRKIKHFVLSKWECVLYLELMGTLQMLTRNVLSKTMENILFK